MDEVNDKQEQFEKTLIEKLAGTLLFQEPKVLSRYDFGRSAAEILNDGSFFYLLDSCRIRHVHSRADSADGRTVNTRSAKYKGTEEYSGQDQMGIFLQLISTFEEQFLILKRHLYLYETGEIVIRLELRDKRGAKIRSRYLAPLDAPYPDKTGNPLFLSLDQKMLLVPYDNDMWARYESAVPRPGRTSYDVTAIYNEQTFEGLVVGAMDFDVWKNAIVWSAHDARAFTAFCGVADAATHDMLPHGIVSGESVISSRFVMFWSSNIKEGMVRYGALCTKFHPPRPWRGKSVFGWNSYSALGLGLKLSHWEEAGDFIRKELPAFCDEDGISYINLDGCFGMSRKEIRRIVDKLHANGQKAGWYAAPCIAMKFMSHLPPFSSMILKDERGQPLPPADGSLPLDVTHPLWEKYARNQIKSVLDLGFDYIKLDFLSHAGVEGRHYRKEFTGRMALNHAYRIIENEISKAGREVFVSLSIAPLFPYHLGNARRSCCDSFGHMDDTRYVLNALNFGWWTNGTLYRYNDPDHLALYHSVIDGRPETAQSEARSRYLSGLISGTLMILSDNYGPEGDPDRIHAARQRTKALANNQKLNELAQFGKAFVPVELGSDTASCYTLCHQGRYFAALFNFSAKQHMVGFSAPRGNLPIRGRTVSLWDGAENTYQGELNVTLDGFDCAIFEIFP